MARSSVTWGWKVRKGRQKPGGGQHEERRRSPGTTSATSCATGRERRSCRDAQASPAKSLSRPFRIPVHISSRRAHLRETADRNQGRNLRLFRPAARPSHTVPVQSVAMQRSRNGHSMG